MHDASSGGAASRHLSTYGENNISASRAGIQYPRPLSFTVVLANKLRKVLVLHRDPSVTFVFQGRC